MIHGHALPSAILLFPVLLFTLSCSSLQSVPDWEIPAEVVSPHDEPADSPENEVLLLPETVMDEEPGAAEENDDSPEIWRRTEETLAYLDTPVKPDLPEPEYAIPEPPALAETEEPPPDAELPIEPAAEVAEKGEDEIPPAEDTVTEELSPPSPPLPPATLRPVQEVAALPPPRNPVQVPPKPLPMQPARVEPAQHGGTPVRTIQAVPGENAEIPLAGSGWVYLGEENGQSGLAYRQRYTSADGQVFVFRPEAGGVYRLTFKKQDLLHGTEANEIVTVTVAEKKTAAEPVSELSSKLDDEPAIAAAPADDGAPIPVDIPPEPQTIEAAPVLADDAALWDRARELESGPGRDIKGALAAYKTLVRDYPLSGYYADSQKRIAYIERFFVNIH
jgi:hypothetical protein